MPLSVFFSLIHFHLHVSLSLALYWSLWQLAIASVWLDLTSSWALFSLPIRWAAFNHISHLVESKVFSHSAHYILFHFSFQTTCQWTNKKTNKQIYYTIDHPHIGKCQPNNFTAILFYWSLFYELGNHKPIALPIHVLVWTSLVGLCAHCTWWMHKWPQAYLGFKEDSFLGFRGRKCTENTRF